MKNLLMVALLAIISLTFANAQTLDAAYPAVVTKKSQVFGSYLFADGKYLLFGEFGSNNGVKLPGIIKFNADGSVDNTFSVGTGPNGSVEAVAVQSDGKILVGGRFTVFNGVSRPVFIRLNTDGSVDNTFATNVTFYNTGMELAIVIQPDGKILFNGPVSALDGVSTGGSTLVRFNSNGSRDATFTGPSFAYQARGMALQTDGKIVVVGSFTNRIVRLTATGALDPIFNPGTGFDALVNVVQISPTNQIFVGGSFSNYNGSPANYLVCLNTSAAIDATWTGNGKPNNSVDDAQLLSDGKLVIVGNFTAFNASSAKSIARIGTTGALDASLVIGTGPNSDLSAVHVNASGEIIITGSSSFTSYNGTARPNIAVLQSNGTLKAMTVVPNLQEQAWVRSIVAQGTTKFIIGHSGTEVNGTASANFSRLNVDGTLDATFQGDSKPNNSVEDIAIDAGGNILIGGSFTTYNGTTTGRFARLSSEGVLETAFNTNMGTGFNSSITSIVTQPDGKILVGGGFSTFNSVARRCILRLNSDGTLDASFNAGNGFSTSTSTTVVYSIALQSDGKIIVAGEFNSFSGAVRNLVRLNADGTRDNTFAIGTGVYNTSGSNSVNDIAVLSTGKILVGGHFANIGAGTNNAGSLALLSSTGALENGYTSNSFFIVEGLEKQSDGKIIVIDRNTGLRRLNADGTLDNTFSNFNLEPYPEEIAFFGNSMIVSGWLASANQKVVMGLAKVDLPAAAPTAPTALASTAVAQTSINLSWAHTGTTESGFFLERSVGTNTNYTVIATLPANTLTYINTGLTANTNYFYRLRAYNAAGTSAYSNAFNTATLPDPPSAPGTLTLSVASAAEIKLTWIDFASNETAYEIHRSVGNNTSYSLYATTTANAITYSDLSVTVGTLYYYKVRAVNTGGNSNFNTEKSITAANPNPPINFSLTVIGATNIRLNWTDNSLNESGFEVYRSVGNNTNYTLLTTTAANANTYSDLTVTNGTTYFYRVRTINNGGASAYATEQSATAANPIPAVPTNLQATGVQGNRVNLTWSDNSGNETGFEIERAEGSGSFSLIHTTAANVSSYSDLTVTHSVSYFYRIRSAFGTSKSAYTSQVNVVPPAPLPAAPTNFVAVATSGTTIALTWVDNASDEVDYFIERSPNGNTNYTQLAIVPANTAQYTDATVTFEQFYYYRVRARNANGVSAALERSLSAGSIPMGTKTITACQGYLFDSGLSSNYSNSENSILTIFPATAGSSIQLNFSSFSTEAADQLSIFNGTSTTAPLIGTYSGAASPGTVRATNPDGALTLAFTSNASVVNTGWFAIISCGIFTATPGNVQVSVPNMGEIKLEWRDDATNETGYIIERATTTASAFSQIQTLPANATTFADNNVVPNRAYFYRVKASGTQNDSYYSAVQGVVFGEGGLWKLRKDFAGSERTDAVAFAVNGKGYVGTGWAGGAQTANFRSYDAANDFWSTQVAGFGGSVRSETAGFVIGSKAYVGTGEWLDSAKDLYEYDPVGNAWTRKADFGGTARTGAIGFSIGNNGYFGLGRDAAGYTKDLWRYDAAANTWAQMADFPGDARTGAVVFVIGDYAYAGTGFSGTARLKDFYKYDPVANTWTPVAAFPGLARRNAVAFTIDGKGYVGTGESGNEERDFYRYDPTTDTWQQVVHFAGTRAYAVSFALNGKGYVTTGWDGVNNLNDLWEFSAGTIESAPVAPSALNATPVSTSQIDLTWADNSANETGFVIERSLLISSNFAVVATLPADATSYSDTGLGVATTYYYRVKITTPSGGSTFTPTANATTLPLPPAAPSNLTATLSNGLVVQLAWTDNATNDTGVTIERSVGDNLNFTTLASISALSNAYNDFTTSHETKYFYRVKSTNAGGSSSYSNEVTITTTTPPITSPSNLIAQAISATSIRLTWADNSNNENSFRIMRSSTPTGTFLEHAFVGVNVSEYVNTGLTENTTYYYRVIARGATFESTPTAVASATTLKSIPLTPANLTATYDATLDNITLQWTDASFNEDEFVLQKAFTANAFSDLLSTVNTTHIDENPGTNFRVFYRVAAKNSAGMSAFSNVAQIVITGLEDEAGILGIKTYPNPAVDNKVMVEWTSADRGEVNLRLFDVAGRELKAASFEKNSAEFKQEIDLTDVSGNAIIMLKVSLGQQVVVKKIVVK